MGTVSNVSSSWLDAYNPEQAAGTKGTLTGTAGAAKAYATTGSTAGPSLNIYGSGSDLQNAMSKYNGKQGVNFYNVADSNFNPSSMKNGIMLGGSGVNTNINDDILNNSGVQRVWGQTGADTNKALDNYMSSYGKPTMPMSTPTKIATPTYSAFNFGGSMQDYLDQAQNIYKPQKELTESNINTQYDTNVIPQANNDTLSRGLARSSYAGNRVDLLNAARSRDITNADLQLQQQANTLGMQNYNTAYDRAYQGWKDQNANDWQTYNAQNSANQQDFQNNMSLYNTQNEDYWKNKNWDQSQDQWNWQQIKDKNAENWKKQDQANWQAQYDNNNNQWQQQFDYKKTQDQFDNDLKLQQLALSAAKSGRSGSGKSSSSSSKASQSNLDKQVYANFNASSVQDQYGMLHDPDVINNISSTMYKSLQSQYDKNLKNSGLSGSLVQGSQPTWNYEDSNSYIYGGGR